MVAQQGRMRRKLRLARRSLPIRQRRLAALAAARLLTRLPMFHEARRIAVYSCNDGELDTVPLIGRILAADKSLYLPCVRRGKLFFQKYRAGDRLRRDRFNIPAPVFDPRHCVRVGELDLIVVPLVGFDGLGNRLGMGGGFYDRAMAAVGSRSYRRPWLIGYGYDIQRLEHLPVATHDVSMHAVVMAGTCPAGRACLV